MPSPTVEFSLDFTYAESRTPALTQVSGSVPKGRCVVLCGSSGCGKSTLLRCLNHLIPQFYEGELKGFCRIAGQDLEDLSIGQAGLLAASVFQDPRSQFFTLNSDTEVAFGLENAGWSRQQILDRTAGAFRDFHMEKLRNRNVFSLSSGERQLTAILSAWAMDTEILLLDEPTANLDQAAIRQLTQALRVLKDQGKTLLISEHRLCYLKDLADEFWLMDSGQILNRYSAAQMQAMSREALCNLGLRTLDLQQVTCSPASPPEPVRQDRLELRDLRFRYGKTGPEILNGLSLEARTGEVIGLIGTNGCGKTTLGKAAAGLLKPGSGSILLNGTPLIGKALTDRSIFIMQEAEFQFFTNSVLSELSYGRERTPELDREIEELLRFTGLWECRNRHPFSLSGGQMQKLVLLLACLSEKPIVVLDEPTAGLDYKSLQICAQLISRMRRGKIVLLISHDLELLALAATGCVRLDSGTVREHFRLPEDFEALRRQMEDFSLPCQKPEPTEPPRRQLDPRAKLLMVAAALAAGVYTDLSLIGCIFLVLTLAALWEGSWRLTLGACSAMALVCGLYWIHPNVATSFLAHFFPRVILMGFGAGLVVKPSEGPRILAGLRALHVPERVNMILSVIFRFFPVLTADLTLMNQSIRTRGFFGSFSRKLKAAPEYLEILIVPMVFRVLRIAEALSASAETRGISLEGRRESYTGIGWSRTDTVFSVLLAIAAVAGLILP